MYYGYCIPQSRASGVATGFPAIGGILMSPTRSPLVLRFAGMTAPKRLKPDANISVSRTHAAKLRRTGNRHAGCEPVRLIQMARLLRVGLLVTLAIVLGPARAHGDGQTKHLLDLLYPQSVGWTLLSTFPHPPSHLLDDPIHVETLGYFDRLRTDADRCSPIVRMFLGRDKLHRFRSGNVLGPGDDDLVYAGPKPCAEGDWTIIWRHGLDHTSGATVIILDVEVLRILPGPQPKAIGVAPGCCGDPWSYYCLYDPIPHETCVAVPGALIIPHGARLARSDVTLLQDAKLLPVPNATFKQDDPYQPPVRAAGTSVEQLLLVVDGAGRSWHLVKIAAHEGEVSGNASFVVGWVAD